MAKLTDAFPSVFLSAGDLPGDKDVVVKIEKVEKKLVGQGQQAEQKFVLTFVGKKKLLVLNKTNFKAIVAATGEEDTDNWEGHSIRLFVMDVEYQGDLIPAIRVRNRPVNQSTEPLGTKVKSEPKKAPAEPPQENLEGDPEF